MQALIFSVSISFTFHGKGKRGFRGVQSTFEAPCSKLQGIFDRKECGLLLIHSLTPLQAAGNALAFAVQKDQNANAQESDQWLMQRTVWTVGETLSSGRDGLGD
jgi:hypothetical protein